MKTEKRAVANRDFWFTADHVYKEDPRTGEDVPTGRYYCAFSPREPGPLVHGEVLKDDRGLARVFDTPEAAIAAGAEEVQARLDVPTKVYAVGLPSGNTDAEFNAYVELLKESGVNVSKPRVPASYGRQWLHVWGQREDAEAFAAQLRQGTRNRDWQVYELSPTVLPGDEPEEGKGPVVILVGRQSDGETYGLHPTSLKLIRSRFPTIRPRSSVFLGGPQTEPAGTNGAGYDQIAALLTGLSSSALTGLGGYRIIDPISGLILHETGLVNGQTDG